MAYTRYSIICCRA